MRSGKKNRKLLLVVLLLSLTTPASWAQGERARFYLYPVLRFKNSTLDRIYHTQLNFNPTLHLNLWRGASTTAQVIVPIHNGYSKDESKVRPGFLTLTQQINLPAQFKVMATVGNFNQFRAGGDLKLFKGIGENLGLYGQVGATVWSVPFFNEWVYSDNFKVNWRVGANYYLRKHKVLFNVNYSQYLAQDRAVRGEVTRFFKRAAIGFYIQSLGFEGYHMNGGFFFAINLPQVGASWKGKVAARPSSHFDMEYIARPYPDRGVYYRTSPAENSSFNFFNNQLFNKSSY